MLYVASADRLHDIATVVASEQDVLTRSMLLGAAVLIATQAILVGIAIVWYVKNRRARGHTDGE
jgi:hypothetical protein